MFIVRPSPFLIFIAFELLLYQKDNDLFGFFLQILLQIIANSKHYKKNQKFNIKKFTKNILKITFLKEIKKINFKKITKTYILKKKKKKI